MTRLSVILAMVMLIPYPVHAQAYDGNPGAYGGFLQDQTFKAMSETYSGSSGQRLTKNAQEDRLRRALALREKARKMVEAGGGKLTFTQQNRLKAEAYEILND